MAPFYSDEDVVVGGYSKGLTPLIIRMTTIAVVVGSFFQSSNSSIATIVTLVLATVLFEIAGKLTEFLGKILKERECPRCTLSGRQVLQAYLVRRLRNRDNI